MAPPETAAANVANKKNKGLKDHKKAQKEKALAKRSAAAEKANANKTLFAQVVAAVVEETAPMQDVIEAQKDITTTQEKITTDMEPLAVVDDTKTGAMASQSHDDPKFQAFESEDVATDSERGVPTAVGPSNRSKVENTQPFKNDGFQEQNTSRTSKLNPAAKAFLFGKIIIAHTTSKDDSSGSDVSASKEFTNDTIAPEQLFDIVAYRKALEAELYENIETPRQTLVRCKFTVSIDTENHPEVEDEDKDAAFSALCDRNKPTLKCLDDNGFEITPIMTGLTEADFTVRIKASPSSSLCQLFAKVNDLGVSKVGAVRSEERISTSDGPADSDEIIDNLPHAGGLPRDPVSMGRLSLTSDARIAEKPDLPRNLESVEAEMRLAALNRPSHALAFADSGIVRYRIDGRGYDNFSHPVSTTALPTHQRTRSDRVLELFMDEQATSPPGLCPTSSRQSRTSSPIYADRAYTPVTACSNAPPAELPVWHIPFYQPSYVNLYGIAAYAPGILMNSSQGGF